MSEELMVPEDLQKGIVAYDANVLESLAQGTAYLPRLQVNNGSSDLVKEGKCQVGTFALIWTKDKYKELGKELNVLSITMRPKAMRLKPAILAYFNINNPEFGKIRTESQIKDSQCLYGLEFLLWMPDQGEFSTLFCGSRSARQSSAGVLDQMVTGEEDLGEGKKRKIYGPRPVTLRTHFVPKTDTRKHSWFTFVATQCSAPLTHAPDEEKLREEVQKFNNPPESQVEAVSPEGATTDGRER